MIPFLFFLFSYCQWDGSYNVGILKILHSNLIFMSHPLFTLVYFFFLKLPFPFVLYSTPPFFFYIYIAVQKSFLVVLRVTKIKPVNIKIIFYLNLSFIIYFTLSLIFKFICKKTKQAKTIILLQLYWRNTRYLFLILFFLMWKRMLRALINSSLKARLS